MSKTLYLMQGIPGSGKSAVAEMIRSATDGLILSTDEWWYTSDGTYKYESHLAGEAHRWNQLRALQAMMEEKSNIIIDNTNITQEEAQPYLILAKIFGYQIEVIRVEANVDVCCDRQYNRPPDRRIPDKVIRRKNMDIERLVI